MKQAVNELKKFTMDEIQRSLYQSRLMAIMDEASKIDEYYEKGLEKGRIEGIKEGKIEGVEIAMDVKFGEKSLYLMKKIREISEIEKLIQAQKAIKQAKDVHEFEKMLEKLLG